jgi:hypothetical protein
MANHWQENFGKGAGQHKWNEVDTAALVLVLLVNNAIIFLVLAALGRLPW